ncbi:MAG: sigma-54-dependent Fis family transcriptional regulator [Candidatus Eisenbacteria bacterium]|nr:sigma-54-dependent Fis family transcriptional regulator [Candidatus Eisenbacteria bacterium]
MKPRALVLDDEPLMRDFLGETLRGAGYEVVATGEPAEALDAWPAFAPDVVFLDLRLPGTTGVDVLREARSRGGSGACVFLTAYGTVESAVAALKEGAEDYLLKPCSADLIERAAAQALRVSRLRGENRRLKELVRESRAHSGIVGNDPALRAVLEQLPALARSRATALVLGESGTGKELVARALHDLGPRAEGPWVSVNCAAVPEGLLESELFGYEKGAFTGAGGRHPGRFEQAHGGTLLLDEISEISPALQAKLLRVLQEREFYRLGGAEPVRVDVRVVATSNRDVPAMIARGAFRADLFYRLNVVTVTLPPLRQRAGDIPLLASHFVARVAAESGRDVRAVSPEALEGLQRHAWPGNIRELRNAVERAVVFARSEVLQPADFRLDEPLPAPHGTLNLDELERSAIRDALQACGGNRMRAAETLGISVRTLRNKLRQYREEAGAQNLPPGAAEIAHRARPAAQPALRVAA